MEKFDFNKLADLNDKVTEATRNYDNYVKQLRTLFKSRPDWRTFLKHYCCQEDKEDCYVSMNHIYTDFKIDSANNTIVIKWENSDEYGEAYETRKISVKTFEDYLYNDNFFTAVRERLDRIKKAKEETIKRETEERERREYERLKEKFG